MVFGGQSRTVYVNLGPAVIEYILQTIYDFANDDYDDIITKIDNKLKTDLGVNDESDPKYKVIMARAEYQKRSIQPELCAQIYNQIFNAYERYKEQHELARKSFLRLGLTIPRWRIISSIFSLKAILVRPPASAITNMFGNDDLTLAMDADLTTAEKTILDMATRFEALVKYEVENRGFKRMTHAV